MKRKVVHGLLALSIILSTIGNITVPVFAAETKPDTQTEAIVYNQAETKSDTQAATIAYNQASRFTVSIPKAITLDSDKAAIYTIGVTGDINGNEGVYVTPDSEVVLSDANGKPSVTGTVSQEKTLFLSDEFTSENQATGNGKVCAAGLTAGDWTGTLNFAINMNPCRGKDIALSKDNLSEYGISTSGDVQIPIYVKDSDDILYKVARIDDKAFDGCARLTSITIPDSVTSIGNYAFCNCSNLTSITLPDSVTSIGQDAFSCTKLTSITLPDSVTSISEGTFGGCTKLTSITIPDSVTSIGKEAFKMCYALTSITIPSSVTDIGDDAFEECTKLTSITIPDSVTSIGYGVFSKCSNLTSINVDNNNPIYDSRNNCNAIIETKTNTLIADCKNTIIPDSVTSIGDYAFQNSEITSITIPDSVERIGISAFYYCQNLTNITIPASVTSIGKGAFSNCSGVTSIGVDNNNPIYDSRDNCNAIIEKGTLIVGCKNTIIPDGVTSIGNNAFSDCSFTNIVIPDGVTSIGDYAFGACSNLTNITIPDSVESIGDYAFGVCSNLTNITIPDSVESIGKYAFYYCENLSSVTYKGTQYTSRSSLESALKASGVSVPFFAFTFTKLTK